MIRFLALYFLILSIFLGPPMTKADLDFDLSTATAKSYKKFIENLRNALPYSEKVFKIPVLLSTVPNARRFTLVNLTNYNGEIITVAIDVTNVYVVGYLARDVSYFFDEPSALEASKFVFTDGTQKVTVPYSGNYERLQSMVGKVRDQIEIGLPALSSAITTLFYYKAKPAASAFLVLIQTLAEAARYKYIEQEISKDVSKNFKPNLAIISLENEWSALSKQILIASNNGGQFEKPVELINSDGIRFKVTNSSSNVVQRNILLLLGSKGSTTDDNDIVTTLRPEAISMSITTTITNGQDETIEVLKPTNCRQGSRSIMSLKIMLRRNSRIAGMTSLEELAM